MSNLKFYITLNIFNILLSIFLFGYMCLYGFCIFFAGFLGASTEMLYCGLILYVFYIVLKLLLPKLFVFLANKYKNSIINKLAHFLYNNLQNKKTVIAIAFFYDLIFVLYDVPIKLKFIPFSDFIVRYVILYLGGILLFYIMLYKELYKLENTKSNVVQ